MKKAPPPTVPYLGILLSEMSGIVEGMPTYLEESLINFSKMRKVRDYDLTDVEGSPGESSLGTGCPIYTIMT